MANFEYQGYVTKQLNLHRGIKNKTYTSPWYKTKTQAREWVAKNSKSAFTVNQGVKTRRK